MWADLFEGYLKEKGEKKKFIIMTWNYQGFLAKTVKARNQGFCGKDSTNINQGNLLEKIFTEMGLAFKGEREIAWEIKFSGNKIF